MQSLQTGERRVLVEGGTHARFFPTGHLVYGSEGRVMAAPFDPARLEVTGSAVPIFEDRLWRVDPSAVMPFSFASPRSLIYIPSDRPIEKTLVWADHQGVIQPVGAPPRNYLTPRLSPDGQRIAVTIAGDDRMDIWVYDLERETLTRLTFGGSDRNPLWSPDGKRVTFTSFPEGPPEIFWKAADGSGPEERLMNGEGSESIPLSWSPDGQALIFSEYGNPLRSWDLWVFSREGEPKRWPFLQTEFRERLAALSSDGRWIAYASNESGRREIYVQPFPGPGAKWQISTDGGTAPVWNPNGSELFYIDRESSTLWAVEVKTRPAFAVGKPRLLFQGKQVGGVGGGLQAANYDVTPDGRRFVMVREEERQAEPTQFNIVVNWLNEVRRLVPTH